LLLTTTSGLAWAQGVPFGAFNLPVERFGGLFTGAMLDVSPKRVVEKLEAAREADLRLVVSLPGGSKKNYRKPDKTFDLEPWKGRMDRFLGIDLAPFVAEGTLLANYLIDEPKCRSCWGGERIPNQVLDEMAAYSRRLFPELPTTVRVEPSVLEQPGWTWQHLDGAWAQFSARKAPVEDYLAKQVESARRQGLALIVGLNVIAGGDGSSGIRSKEPWSDHWAMSADEILMYGSALLRNSDVCAFIMWRYFEPDEYAYYERPDVHRALTEISRRAAARSPTSCRPPARATEAQAE
jgi:hypothetical protein